MSFTARRKIQKEKGQEPDEFEESVAQALFDLESTNSELKSELRDLFINSAKEVDVSGNRKAVIIHVPYRLRKAFQKIHARLVRELEKKFSGKDVVVIATRRILRPPKKGSAVNRPRSRTLTTVHEAVLEDLVYPSEIVGKRVVRNPVFAARLEIQCRHSHRLCLSRLQQPLPPRDRKPPGERVSEAR